MKYVKLTAKPDTWFKEGTEVFDYDAEYELGQRLTLDEYKSWGEYVICVRGITYVEEDSHEAKLFGEGYRIDGESCGLSEFELEIVDEPFGKVENLEELNNL
jgi:hypothetical protein